MNSGKVNNELNLRDYSENRSRVIELAAYFDRISPDEKQNSIRKALELLVKVETNHVVEVQKAFSDGVSEFNCC